MQASIVLDERGHDVTLFEASDKIGGQLNMAAVIPGKEEFHETLRYYRAMLEKYAVTVKLGERVEAAQLAAAGFDAVLAGRCTRGDQSTHARAKRESEGAVER